MSGSPAPPDQRPRERAAGALCARTLLPAVPPPHRGARLPWAGGREHSKACSFPGPARPFHAAGPLHAVPNPRGRAGLAAGGCHPLTPGPGQDPVLLEAVLQGAGQQQAEETFNVGHGTEE